MFKIIFILLSLFSFITSNSNIHNEEYYDSIIEFIINCEILSSFNNFETTFFDLIFLENKKFMKTFDVINLFCKKRCKADSYLFLNELIDFINNIKKDRDSKGRFFELSKIFKKNNLPNFIKYDIGAGFLNKKSILFNSLLEIVDVEKEFNKTDNETVCIKKILKIIK